MILAGYIFLLTILCVAMVWRWGYGALYPLLLASFTQNFILSFLYTTGLTGPESSKALIYFKEILLLVLVIYAAWHLLGHGIHPPSSLLLLILFTLWCLLRGLLAVLQGDDFANAGRLLRNVCMPLQVFTVGLAAALQPQVVETILRRVVPVLSVLALAAVMMFFSVGTEFWVQYANIANYNVELKGEDPSEQVEEIGVSGTGRGRPEFALLSRFRAVGTFGDPISLGFAMAFAILLATLFRRYTGATWLFLPPLGAALLLSFTRSAWTFLAVALGVISIRRQNYLLMILMLACIGLALTIPQLSDFILSSVEKLAAGDPNDLHAEGLRSFYQSAWRDPRNLLGKGTSASVRNIPESGYGFLLEHFGFPAYALFVLLNVTMFLHFSRGTAPYRGLAHIGQGTIAATLVTMHTSHYAFSFIGYLMIWFVLGALTTLQAARERPELDLTKFAPGTA